MLRVRSFWYRVSWSVCLSVGRSVKKMSKSLKQRDFNIELETKKTLARLGRLLISLQTLFSVCLSIYLLVGLSKKNVKNWQKSLNRGISTQSWKKVWVNLSLDTFLSVQLSVSLSKKCQNITQPHIFLTAHTRSLLFDFSRSCLL